MIRDIISIENAKIGFRNFSGNPGKYNPPGRRNFCVFFDTESGNKLKEDGWNIRWAKSRDEDDDPTPFLQVAVSYSNPKLLPEVLLVTSKGKTSLDEETIDRLDRVEIINVDVKIRPYNWEVNNKQGVKAYLSKIFVTIDEDDLEKKYYDVPNAPLSDDGDRPI